jgi:acetylornithine/succinyldiaminopimelate/putrescine aminotransferase
MCVNTFPRALLATFHSFAATDSEYSASSTYGGIELVCAIVPFVWSFDSFLSLFRAGSL